MRGVASGLIWGVVATGVGLIVASLLAPMPEMPALRGAPATPPVLDTTAEPDSLPAVPEPAAAPAKAPATGSAELAPGSEFNRPAPQTPGRMPGTDTPVVPAPAPDAPAPAGIATRPAPDTTPAITPKAGIDTPDAMTAPKTGETGAVNLPAMAEAPVQPGPAPVSPPAPGTEMPPVAPQNPPAPRSDAAVPPAETPPVGIGVPVPALDIPTPGVRIGRLPTIGAGGPEQEAPEGASAGPDPARLGALARYGAPFQPEDGTPLFSVILIDAGPDGLDRAALTTFTFPVTFAIDASRPDAAEALADYRAAGFEVVLLTGGMPQGATPQDLEVALTSYLSDLPQTVAVMDPETGGFQTNRPLLRQLMAIVKESGHGVITYDRGLNTAEQIAQSADVPAGLVFRTLDANRETAPTIRRYLDRAAFKATQDGHVIMVGHSYAETVTALFAWALEGKGAEVQMAPVSAILRGR
ncbi:divergent polysaccharide deacetylase family protein [Actibacterium sp. D379-3]